MKIAIPLANGKLAMHFGHCERGDDGLAVAEDDQVLGPRTAPAEAKIRHVVT